MADNLDVTPGSGATVAAKEAGGVLHQRALLEVLDGSGLPVDVSGTNRLPVDKLDEVVYLLSSILEKLPRVDAADRLLVSHSESNPTVSIASAQTLATVTTLVGLTNVGGRDAAHAAFALANAGAMHIYDNIRVTA